VSGSSRLLSDPETRLIWHEPLLISLSLFLLHSGNTILTCLFTLVESGEEWPPRESDVNASPMHNSSITDNSSPWTYENGSLNPNLQPSNSQTRKRNVSQTSIPGASSLPPYHPDYKEGDQDAYNPGNRDEQESPPRGRLHVRRGSEGYEVCPEEREEMLQRYLTELGEKPGRYLRYIPQPESEEGTSDDDIPLAQRKEMIGQQ